MAGLFGFFVREPRPGSWMADRLELLRRTMVRRPWHRCHVEVHPHAAFGITGPGILAGSLTPWRHANGAVLLAEGEVYRRGSAPWPGVLDQWVTRGSDSLAAVDGLYNLLRYDPPSAGGPRLTLLNDRYGARRLFIAEDGETVAFASDFQPLAAWLGEALEIDPAFIRDTVCLPSGLEGRTWARQIRLLDPRTELSITPQRFASRRYWSWDALPALGTNISSDPVADTHERWREVIAARMTGDRMGQQLSGGLDSRLILAEAARQRQPWPSLTYGQPEGDEVRFARQAAADAGSPWHLLQLPGPDWLQRRIDAVLENGGFIDLINCHHAGRLDEVRGLFEIEMSGFAGDAILGTTYVGLSHTQVMEKLPYWWSPVSQPFEEVQARVEAELAANTTWGFMMDQKIRRHINWWPHSAVNEIEVRKPFLDYSFVEHCTGLPWEPRYSKGTHTTILRRYFPAMMRAPVQKTGVRPGRGAAGRLGMAALRRLHRYGQRRGLPLRPWLRGATNVEEWLRQPGIEARIRSLVQRPDAAVGTYFDRSAIDQLLAQTFTPQPQVATEVTLHLLRVELVLRRMPEWCRSGRGATAHCGLLTQRDTLAAPHGRSTKQPFRRSL